MPARPLHIFQAMGLIGLEPGSPVGYDEKRNQLIPPKGAPLDISVRYGKAGKEKTVSVVSRSTVTRLRSLRSQHTSVDLSGSSRISALHAGNSARTDPDPRSAIRVTSRCPTLAPRVKDRARCE